MKWVVFSTLETNRAFQWTRKSRTFNSVQRTTQKKLKGTTVAAELLISFLTLLQIKSGIQMEKNVSITSTTIYDTFSTNIKQYNLRKKKL